MKRSYPDGSVVWVARYRDLSGKIQRAKPRWNGGTATFARHAEAQRAIDEALAEQRGSMSHRRRSATTSTAGGSGGILARSGPTAPAPTGSSRYWESGIEGRPLGEWLFDELRRRHVHLILEHLLIEQGRSAQGARGVLRAFSTMTEDAIGDDFAEINAFRGVRLRANDPRVRKPPRRIRIWSFEQMREFAAGRPCRGQGQDPAPR
jgi:hypothetical protein